MVAGESSEAKAKWKILDRQQDEPLGQVIITRYKSRVERSKTDIFDQ
jgi:hypothetical protein